MLTFCTALKAVLDVDRILTAVSSYRRVAQTRLTVIVAHRRSDETFSAAYGTIHQSGNHAEAIRQLGEADIRGLDRGEQCNVDQYPRGQQLTLPRKITL